MIPNGTTRRWLEAGEAEVGPRRARAPEDRFVWTYAGNLGLSFGLDSVLDAAGLLAGERVPSADHRRGTAAGGARASGGGAAAGSGGVPRPDDAPTTRRAHLRASDALLVPHRRELTKVVTSKLFDFCAVGRPVILAADGEMRRLVDEADSALAVPAEDPAALADAAAPAPGRPGSAGSAGGERPPLRRPRTCASASQRSSPRRLRQPRVDESSGEPRGASGYSVRGVTCIC